MWAAILAMTILRSADAGSLQELLDKWMSPPESSPGYWTLLDVNRQNLSGTIPDAVGMMTALEYFELSYNILRGPIPHAVGSMQRLKEFQVKSMSSEWIDSNKLRGPIPHAVGSWSRLSAFNVVGNDLSGSIPHAVSSWAPVSYFGVDDNSLCGPLPQAVGGLWPALDILRVSNNCLCGPIPHAVVSWGRLHMFLVGSNQFRGPIPVGSMRHLAYYSVRSNQVSGSIPHDVGSWARATRFHVFCNQLRGPIPHAVGSMQQLKEFMADTNSLEGPIPHVFGFTLRLEHFNVHENGLEGPIPHAVGALAALSRFVAHDNALSGSIPSGLFMRSGVQRDSAVYVCIHRNRFTGTLPALKNAAVLTASENFLEGGLPSPFNSELRILDVSGVLGRSGGLIGHLRPALCRATDLKILAIARQQMYGSIPSFTSTLSLLALHDNRLMVLSDLHILDSASRTTILLHNNLLSCYVPTCGNAAVKTSIIAIGNRFRYPKGMFPPWVLEHERDPLLWISGTEGMSSVQKISGAAGMFMVAVVAKLGSAKLMRAMSGWQNGPQTHLWVVKASSQVRNRLAMDSPLAAMLIVLLLSKTWDLYVCPQTLATLSAGSQSSALIRTLVFLWWCKLSFHSLAVGHLTMEDEKHKNKLPAKLLGKRLLLWSQWCVLTLVLSVPAISYQVAKSIPGFLQAGKMVSLGLQACVGATQGLVSSVLIPRLAGKMTGQKHAFTTVSNLIMNCVIPVVVIIYLDTGCLGRWVSFWKTCQIKSHLFQCRVIHKKGSRHPDLEGTLSNPAALDITVLRPRDICNPHVSWTFSSMSRCSHVTLLRLQEIWLSKFITTGLAMPGLALMAGRLPRESGAIAGNIGIYMAYALLSSGHLPLMNFILLLAFLGEGLVASLVA